MLDTNDQFPEPEYGDLEVSQTLEDWFFDTLMDHSRDAWRVAPVLAQALTTAVYDGACPICQDDDQDV